MFNSILIKGATKPFENLMTKNEIDCSQVLGRVTQMEGKTTPTEGYFTPSLG
jgi:hypothetical protein